MKETLRKQCVRDGCCLYSYRNIVIFFLISFPNNLIHEKNNLTQPNPTNHSIIYCNNHFQLRKTQIFLSNINGKQINVISNQKTKKKRSNHDLLIFAFALNFSK